MKTGGGKSMLWMVPHQLEEDAKSIVVCPFVALLNEQYENTTASGLRCHKFSDHNVPDDVQVLFMQVEHCASERFTM
jgi:superfamily II DNA helicase RecQ